MINEIEMLRIFSAAIYENDVKTMEKMMEIGFGKSESFRTIITELSYHSPSSIPRVIRHEIDYRHLCGLLYGCANYCPKNISALLNRGADWDSEKCAYIRVIDAVTNMYCTIEEVILAMDSFKRHDIEPLDATMLKSALKSIENKKPILEWLEDNF